MNAAQNKRFFLRCFIVVIVLFLCGEVFARYFLGLGNPPLYVGDSDIEYMLKPNQDVNRFGNRYIVNQYGMRSKRFEQKKDKEIRILLFGDSVLNGGSLTDHNELATTLLENRLNEIYNEHVVTGNASAGSWGPGNWLAYARKYGFLETDMVILIISSHDYMDNPTFKPLDYHYPTEKPVSALLEGFNRYFVPRFLPALTGGTDEKEHTTSEFEAGKKGLQDLEQFLEMAKHNSDSVMVFQHWGRAETTNDSLQVGNKRISALCARMNIPAVELGPAYQAALRKNEQPFRDKIHPNPIGQRLIFETILKELPDFSLSKQQQ